MTELDKNPGLLSPSFNMSQITRSGEEVDLKFDCHLCRQVRLPSTVTEEKLGRVFASWVETGSLEVWERVEWEWEGHPFNNQIKVDPPLSLPTSCL